MAVPLGETELLAMVYEKVKRTEFSVVKPGGALAWAGVRVGRIVLRFCR